MAIKSILTEPNKLLRQISKPVEKITKEEQKLMDDMLDTMYEANGIGLAAIQIGIPKRILVMDISKDPEKKEPRYFVNPLVKNKNPEEIVAFIQENHTTIGNALSNKLDPETRPTLNDIITIIHIKITPKPIVKDTQIKETHTEKIIVTHTEKIDKQNSPKTNSLENLKIL